MSYLTCIYICKECMCIRESFIITCFQISSSIGHVKARGGGTAIQIKGTLVGNFEKTSKRLHKTCFVGVA